MKSKPAGLIKTGGLILYFLFTPIMILFGALFLFDNYVDMWTSSLPGGTGGHDLSSRETSFQYLELFPFTGWHAQSNFHHRGPMPWEATNTLYEEDFDIESGPMGFFMEFDPTKPPPKKANEFRIILIGGSGAQGWGAQTNEHMLYKQLEKRLNEIFDETGLTIRVLNMAMGSSITVNNFIALNMWGHPLQPDLILSYSGRNDWVVPYIHEGSTDTFFHFSELNTLVYASRGSVFPPIGVCNGLKICFLIS